jgi:cell division septum initiation protein DivIVA
MERDSNTSALLERLNALHERIAQTRTAFEGHGPIGDHLEQDLATFVQGHDEIRRSIESYQTMTNQVLSTASAATDNLETRMKEWLQALEARFNTPAKRNNSVSM